MIKYIGISLLFVFTSCSNGSNKMIKEFSDKIENFEDQVDNMTPGQSTDELMKTADELSLQIDALNAQDLDEKQQGMVGALAIRLSIAIQILQDNLQKQLQETISHRPVLPDSLPPLKTDSI